MPIRELECNKSDQNRLRIRWAPAIGDTGSVKFIISKTALKTNQVKEYDIDNPDGNIITYRTKTTDISVDISLLADALVLYVYAIYPAECIDTASITHREVEMRTVSYRLVHDKQYDKYDIFHFEILQSGIDLSNTRFIYELKGFTYEIKFLPNTITSFRFLSPKGEEPKLYYVRSDQDISQKIRVRKENT